MNGRARFVASSIDPRTVNDGRSGEKEAGRGYYSSVR